MTGRRAAFGSLFYTDCLPGQGLRGVAGFQFQAASPEVGHDEMSIVQRSALYEPPPEWIRRRRPVELYPPSLAHVFEDRFVTARGIYLGTEANGMREGNQFTHAITTGDPEAYGQLRPAQLWGAPWWAERPAPTTRCEGVGPEPQPGPWTAHAVRSWVAGQPGAEDFLIAVVSALSALRSDSPQRIVFVAEDPEPVFCWLIAGTLLLPQRVALRVSFRAFVSNLQYSRHDVLAVHPDWAGSVRESGFCVFDLRDRSHTVARTAPVAHFWVPRFLGADPLDVIDAVELADQLGDAADPAEELAAQDRLAASTLRLREPVRPADAAALANWLKRQPPAVVAEVGQPLAAQILATAPGLEARYDLYEALYERSDARLREQLRSGVLAAELADARAHHTWEESQRHLRGLRVLPSGELTGDAAGQEVAEALDRAEPAQCDALLQIATRHGVPVAPERGQRRFAGFCRWWADHPELDIHPARWNCAPAMVLLLREELKRRLADPATRDATVTALRTRWWKVLWTSIHEPARPLDHELAGAAAATGDAGLRRDVLTHVARKATEHDDLAAWTALTSQTRLDLADAGVFLGGLPAGHRISPALAERMLDLAARGNRGLPTAAKLDLLDRLTALGHELRRHPFAGWHHEDRLLHAWLAHLRSPRRPRPEPYELDRLSEAVLAAREDTVLPVLVGARGKYAAFALRGAGHAMHRLLIARLPRLLKREAGADGLAVLALDLQWSGVLPDAENEALLSILADWTRLLDRQGRQRITALVGELDEENLHVWQSWIKSYGVRSRRARSRAAKHLRE
ncbi:GTPase-associated protein 1-related protein [Amycolatopsis lurida]